MNYARMLIQMDVTKPLVEEVQVQRVNGVVFKQKVMFVWKPPVCFKCIQLGHYCEVGNAKMVQTWVPKQPITPQEVAGGQDQLVIPNIEPPKETNESELGWIAITKVARHPTSGSTSAV